MQQGAFPLGIVSMIGAIFSVLATRLVGKQNNWGNFIGIFTTITSGVIDYLFGNQDQYYSKKRVAELEEILNSHEIKPKFIEFEGEHKVYEKNLLSLFDCNLSK